MFRAPGSFPRAHSGASSSITPAASRLRVREGKFISLGDFFATAGDGLQQVSRYGPATQAELAPGSIIHIKDNKEGFETRIHNRIMLVVRTNAPVSMTCYSFCRHDPPLSSPHDASTHWLVCLTGRPPQKDNPANLPPLEVYLHYKLVPKDDTTINLRDPWNVEYEVEVAKLGNLTPSSYKAVRHRINQLFWTETPNNPLAMVGANSAGPVNLPGSAEMKRTRTDPGENRGGPKSPTLAWVKPAQARRPSKTTEYDVVVRRPPW